MALKQSLKMPLNQLGRMFDVSEASGFPPGWPVQKHKTNMEIEKTCCHCNSLYFDTSMHSIHFHESVEHK